MDKNSKLYRDLMSESQVLAALHMLSLLYIELNDDQDLTVPNILAKMRELGFTHLAMDADGTLKGFFDEPKKEDGMWYEPAGYEMFIAVENFIEVNEYDKIEDSISFDISDLIIDCGLIENNEELRNTEVWKQDYEDLQILTEYWLDMEDHEYKFYTKEFNMEKAEKIITLDDFEEVEDFDQDDDPFLMDILEDLRSMGIPVSRIFYHNDYHDQAEAMDRTMKTKNPIGKSIYSQDKINILEDGRVFINDKLITNKKKSIEIYNEYVDKKEDDIETIYEELGGFDHYIMDNKKEKKNKETQWQKIKRKINMRRAKKLIGKKVYAVSMGYIPKDDKRESSKFINNLKDLLHEHILLNDYDTYMDTDTIFVMVRSDGQVWISKEDSDLDNYTKIGVIPTAKGVSEEFKTVIEITR